MHEKIFESPECKTLRENLVAEYETYKICPPRELVFSAFEMCDYDDIKVVVLGQDPYFNENQAIGLAFSVSGCGTYKFPPTLKNIIKEVRQTFGECVVEDGDLRAWARQGVLLLNTCLTVRQGQALSHAAIGWDSFIIPALKELDKKNDIVFVLWGSHARGYKKYLSNIRNLVLEAAHPSPLSAHNGFFGCGHFKKINDFLVKRGKKPVVF